MNTNGHTPVPIRFVLHWILYFLICLGIGYPALNRLDARTLEGCIDSVAYFQMTETAPIDAARRQLELRPLIPWVANPVYRLVQGHTGSWNPVALGLLVASSIFTATGMSLLLQLGQVHVTSRAVAFTGTLLYLLNFTTINKHLGCSLVDSGESSLIIAAFWVLFERKYFLLPIVGILGALSKETFIPICAIVILGWAFSQLRTGTWNWRATAWSACAILVGLAVMSLLQASVYGGFMWPWEFAASQQVRSVGLLRGLVNCFTDHQFLYVFSWLLPLGVLRLKAFPRSWLHASIGGGLAVLAMGAWRNGEGTTMAAVFNAMGPLLSLSAAHFLIAPKNAGKES